jgi:hypothetical protein
MTRVRIIGAPNFTGRIGLSRGIIIVEGFGSDYQSVIFARPVAEQFESLRLTDGVEKPLAVKSE